MKVFIAAKVCGVSQILFYWWQVWDDGSIQVTWLQLTKAFLFDPTLSLVGMLLHWSLATG